MEKSFENHWERVYQNKDTTKVGWHQAKPQVSLDFITKTQSPANTPIIDVGGGDSLLIDHLLELGYQNLWMLDISSSALEKVRARLGEKQEEVNFRVSNVLDFSPVVKFGIWHDRAVFHFLTDAKDQEEYRSLVKEAIYPGGHLIMATFSSNGPTSCSGLPVQQYDIEDLEKFFGPEFELLEGMNYDHITPSGSLQNYSVCLFRRR